MNVVYFVQATDGGPIKIGVAVDLEQRLKSLQYMSPVSLVCLASMPGYTGEEAALHERFAAHRLHGEWFQPTEELMALIDDIGRNPIRAPQPNAGDAFRAGQREGRSLRSDLRRLRKEIQERERDLQHLREVRRRTQWRVYGDDPAEFLEGLSDAVVEDEYLDRLIDTECEIRLTAFWDEAEQSLGIRVLEADNEFSDSAWECIVDAVSSFTSELTARLRALRVTW